jgi:hypothetical protein
MQKYPGFLVRCGRTLHRNRRNDTWMTRRRHGKNTKCGWENGELNLKIRRKRKRTLSKSLRRQNWRGRKEVFQTRSLQMMTTTMMIPPMKKSNLMSVIGNAPRKERRVKRPAHMQG